MMNIIPYRACYVNQVKQTMLFSSSVFNGIFQLNLKNGKLRSLGTIQGERIFQDSLYGEMVFWGEYLLLVPLMARELALLDKESGQCVQKIKLPENEDLYWKFITGIVYENDIILIPALYPCFVSVNMVDFTVTVLQNWKEYLKTKCALENPKRLAVSTIGVQDTVLYLQVFETNYLLKYDLRKKCILRVINLLENSYAYAICDVKKIYVVPGKSGKILCINSENDEIEKTYPMPLVVGENVNGQASIHGKIIDQKLVLFPQMASRIGVVDLKSGKTSSYFGEWSVEKNGKSNNIFQKIKMIDNRYCIALICHENKEDYEYLLIDMNDFSSKRLKIDMEQDLQQIVKACMEKSVEQGEMINERSIHSLGMENALNTFLSIAKRQDRSEWKQEERVGTKIWNLLKKD